MVVMLYSRRLVIAGNFSWNPPNHGQTLIEKPLYSGTFKVDNCYSGHNFSASHEKIKLNLSLYSEHPIFLNKLYSIFKCFYFTLPIS